MSWTRSTPFTGRLLAGLGNPEAQQNLASCLKQMQQDSRLGLQGFLAMGRVPPRLSLWRDNFARNDPPPRPEVVLQAGHADRVTGLAVTADNRTLITSSQDSTVRAWSLKDRRPAPRLVGADRGGHGAGAQRRRSLGRHGRRPGHGPGRRPARLLARRPSPGRRTTKRVDLVRVLPDGGHFVSVDRDGGLAVLVRPRRSPSSPGHGRRPTSVAWRSPAAASATDGTVAALFHDGTVRLFDARGGGGAGSPRGTAVRPPWRSRPTAAPWPWASPTGGHVRDIRGGKETEHQSAPVAVRRLAFSHERLGGRRPRTGPAPDAPGPGRRGRAQRQARRPRRIAPPRSLAFSADGRYLAACTEGLGELKAWRLDGEGAPQLIYEDPRPGPPRSASPATAGRWSAEATRARCHPIAWSEGRGESSPGRSPPTGARSSTWTARPAAVTS